jgi:hypothetical protein
MTTIKGRWGFHPCSHELYRKLKRLHFLAYEAKRRQAAWNRWDRKDPQNRVLWYHHDKPNVIRIGHVTKDQLKGGSKIIIGPAPEPLLAPIVLDYFEIYYDYCNARTPVIETQVKPLIMSEQDIDSKLLKLEEWISLKPVVCAV